LLFTFPFAGEVKEDDSDEVGDYIDGDDGDDMQMVSLPVDVGDGLERSIITSSGNRYAGRLGQ
jgi:hypothetical protein